MNPPSRIRLFKKHEVAPLVEVHVAQPRRRIAVGHERRSLRKGLALRTQFEAQPGIIDPVEVRPVPEGIQPAIEPRTGQARQVHDPLALRVLNHRLGYAQIRRGLGIGQLLRCEDQLPGMRRPGLPAVEAHPLRRQSTAAAGRENVRQGIAVDVGQLHFPVGLREVEVRSRTHERPQRCLRQLQPGIGEKERRQMAVRIARAVLLDHAPQQGHSQIHGSGFRGSFLGRQVAVPIGILEGIRPHRLPLTRHRNPRQPLIQP